MQLRIKPLIWNKAEGRLRAICRLGVFIVVAAVPANLAVLALDATDIPLLERSLRNPLVAIAFLVALVFNAKYVDRRPLADFGLRSSTHWWRNLLAGVAIGGAAASVLALGAMACGLVEITGRMYNDLPETGFGLAWAGQLFRYAGGSVFEEVMSRAFLLRLIAETFRGRLSDRGAVVLAWIATSLLFGILHFANPNATALSSLTLTAIGAFFGLGMVLTQSLAIPIGAHFGWNMLQNCVFGLPNSGQLPHATIITSELRGPTWLTGGDFGLEGGFMCLGAVAVGAGLSLVWVRCNVGDLSIRETLAEPPVRYAR